MEKNGKYPRPNFTVRKEWKPIFEDSDISDAQIRLLILAMFAYQSGEYTGVLKKGIEKDKTLSAIWNYTILPFFIDDAMRYQEKCQKNSEIAAAAWAKRRGLIE